MRVKCESEVRGWTGRWKGCSVRAECEGGEGGWSVRVNCESGRGGVSVKVKCKRKV